MLAIFIELQLSSKVESYFKYPMMHSSRATDGDKPIHSLMTSLVTSDQSRIPKGTDHTLLGRIKVEKGSFLLVSKIMGCSWQRQILPSQRWHATHKAPVKKNIKKSVRKCFL